MPFAASRKMLFSLILSYSVDYCLLKAEINIRVIQKASEWHRIFSGRVQGFKMIPLKEYLFFFAGKYIQNTGYGKTLRK